MVVGQKGRWVCAVGGSFKEVYITCKSPLQYSLNVDKGKVSYLAFTRRALERIALHRVTRQGFADENVSLDLILRGEKIKEDEAGLSLHRYEVAVVYVKMGNER